MPFVQQCHNLWEDDSTYPGVTQAATLTGSALHFWDMHETGSPTTLTDVVNGAVIEASGLTITPNAPYMTAITSGSPITGAIALSNSDFIMVVVGRSLDDGVTTDANGFLGFYWTWGSEKVKVHPYYVTARDNYRTLPYAPHWTRTTGNIYSHALVKRGRYLEHYSLPKGFIDRLDLLAPDSPVPEYATNIPAATSTILGHGGYDVPANDGIGRAFTGSPWSQVDNEAQDYAGIAVHKFYGGAPSVEKIVTGLRWCENDWVSMPEGEKRLYPGWL